MGAFCVFGVSRAISKQLAERKTPTFEGGDLNRRELTMSEWVARRDALAKQLFEHTEKPYRISPELDSPQFCGDWMAVTPAEIRLAKIMVRGPKLDKGGAPVKRLGTVLMTWHEFTGINQFSEVSLESR